MLDTHQTEAVTTTAARIAGGWGQEFHHAALAAEITELYRDLITLSDGWSDQLRGRFILDAADTTACELTTVLDDYLHHDACSSPSMSEHGWPEWPEDRHHTLTTTLALLADEHLTSWLTDRIPELLAAQSHPLEDAPDLSQACTPR